MAKTTEQEINIKFQPFTTVGDIIECDRGRKSILLELYNDIESLLSNPDMDSIIMDELTTEYGDIIKRITNEKEELNLGKCPILISGETSSGKSSFINLLLGVDILPEKLLSCTSTICRLQNSSTKKIIATKEDGTCEEALVNPDDDEATFKTKLKVYVSRKSDQHNYKYVDISYPLPILQEHVIIVDTPGIGTSTALTERLFDYLPEALAFIYMINSGNAGGLQSDRLIKIFDVQKERMTRNKKLSFDSSAAIFICNKWDQVPKGEEDEILEFIYNTLDENWVNLKRNQIFPLSIKDEKSEFESSQEYTDTFKRLMTGINDIIPYSLEARVVGHARWQLQLAKTCLQRIVQSIRLSKLSRQEKIRMKEEAEHRLLNIQATVAMEKSEMLKFTEMECSKLSASLFNHLHSQETFDRMFNWQTHELPDDESVSMVLENARKRIDDRLGKEIRSWCKAVDMCVLPESLRKMFLERCSLIDSKIDQQKQSSINLDGIFAWRLSKYVNKKRDFTPVTFLSRVLGHDLIFMVMSLIKDYFDYKKYKKDKIKFMHESSKKTIKSITKHYLFECLKGTIFYEFERELAYVCDEIVPSKIESDRKFIDDVVNEIRSTECLEKRYTPLETKFKTVIGKILVMHMDYFSEISFPEAVVHEQVELEEIGAGAFSSVRKVHILLQAENILAAAKTIKRELKDDSAYEQLAEIENLRELYHENIVRLYGFVVKKHGSMKFLRVYLELCDNSLEKEVFKEHKVLPCYKLIQVPNESWKFLMKVTSEVCKGLVHIHTSGFVHRDLKLANILMKDGVAKISDVGLSKPECSIKGTVTGTPTHMAPEIINGNVYGSEVDIYSIGIILWELWYFRPAFSTVVKESPPQYRFLGNQHDLFEHVKNGGRPEFNENFPPPDKFQSLVIQCWHQDPKKRPKASDILIYLEQNLDNMSNIDI